jgi:hypothetical protein
MDEMACLETFFPGLNDQSVRPHLLACLETRKAQSEEMLRFFSNYSALFGKPAIAQCLPKARQLRLEARYPPYKFMIADNGDLPESYDAKTLLDCVKSRL